MSFIALRIDDIGASTKVHERYCESRFLNFGFLRDRRVFGSWGPYREMFAEEWEEVFGLLREKGAKLTVAVTACWVEKDGTLIPFPEKFPGELAMLRKGVQEGLIEIAGHGLTHCVLEKNKFLPKLWGSNRSYHREFWDWIPPAIHFSQVNRCLDILEKAFELKVTAFVPPGNVYTSSTVSACSQRGVKVINCNNPKIPCPDPGLKIVGNENVLAFHDRELVLYGVEWLRQRLEELPPETQYRFVSEL